MLDIDSGPAPVIQRMIPSRLHLVPEVVFDLSLPPQSLCYRLGPGGRSTGLLVGDWIY